MTSYWQADCTTDFLGDTSPPPGYVAGEGVDLTVHKESVVVEELKAVELMRSLRAQFICDGN